MLSIKISKVRRDNLTSSENADDFYQQISILAWYIKFIWSVDLADCTPRRKLIGKHFWQKTELY